MGDMVARTLNSRLDDHIGPRFEEAFRCHLRRLAIPGHFGDEVLRVGSYWARGDVEIDAVVLAGTPPTAVAVGEAKWAAQVSARALLPTLVERSLALPRRADDLMYVICARTRVTRSEGVLPVTAADIFA